MQSACAYGDGFASVWDERLCFGVGVFIAGSYSGDVPYAAVFVFYCQCYFHPS